MSITKTLIPHWVRLARKLNRDVVAMAAMRKKFPEAAHQGARLARARRDAFMQCARELKQSQGELSAKQRNARKVSGNLVENLVLVD